MAHHTQDFVWPLTIAKLAGYKQKALVLAVTGQLGTIMHWSGPFIGTLSDRLPERWAARFGRRRPFLVLGDLMCAGGLLLMYWSMNKIIAAHDAKRDVGLLSWLEMLAGLVISNAGGILFYVRMAVPCLLPRAHYSICSCSLTTMYILQTINNSIVPEIVPIAQRGQCVVIQSWIAKVIAMGGTLVTYMLGNHIYFDNDRIWCGPLPTLDLLAICAT